MSTRNLQQEPRKQPDADLNRDELMLSDISFFSVPGRNPFGTIPQVQDMLELKDMLREEDMCGAWMLDQDGRDPLYDPVTDGLHPQYNEVVTRSFRSAFEAYQALNMHVFMKTLKTEQRSIDEKVTREANMSTRLLEISARAELMGIRALRSLHCLVRAYHLAQTTPFIERQQRRLYLEVAHWAKDNIFNLEHKSDPNSCFGKCFEQLSNLSSVAHFIDHARIVEHVRGNFEDLHKLAHERLVALSKVFLFKGRSHPRSLAKEAGRSIEMSMKSLGFDESDCWHMAEQVELAYLNFMRRMNGLRAVRFVLPERPIGAYEYNGLRQLERNLSDKFATYSEEVASFLPRRRGEGDDSKALQQVETSLRMLTNEMRYKIRSTEVFFGMEK